MITLPDTICELTPAAGGTFALATMKNGVLHVVEQGQQDMLSAHALMDKTGSPITADVVKISADGELAACLRGEVLTLYAIPSENNSHWIRLGTRPGVSGSFCFAADGACVWNLDGNRLKRFSTTDLSLETEESAGHQPVPEVGESRLLACLPNGGMITWHDSTVMELEIVELWPAGLGEMAQPPVTIGQFHDYEWVEVLSQPVGGYLAVATISAPDPAVEFLRIPAPREEPEEGEGIEFLMTWGTSTLGISVDPDASRFLVWNAERPSRLVLSIDPSTREDQEILLPDGHGPHLVCGLKGGLLLYSPFTHPDSLSVIGIR